MNDKVLSRWKTALEGLEDGGDLAGPDLRVEKFP